MTLAADKLNGIVSHTRRSVACRADKTPLPLVEARALEASRHAGTRDFAGAIRGRVITVIAEIKRASPSKGWLNRDLDAPEQARSYARGGAAALSVLTEEDYFHGSFADLESARSVVSLPVLCKDFILGSYQVYEARVHGADAVLLIAAILEARELEALLRLAQGLGMAGLVEAHDEREVDKALAAGATVVGINNRNLSDFTVDLNTTLRLAPLLPPSVTVVSESGISGHSDVAALQSAGIHAVLVGEALVTARDPAHAIRALLSGP